MKHLALITMLGFLSANAWAWREARVNPRDQQPSPAPMRPEPEYDREYDQPIPDRDRSERGYNRRNPRRNRPNPPAYGQGERHRRNFDQFREFNGKQFVPVQPLCNVQDVKIQVMGGDVTIREVTLLFNRSTERLPAKMNYRSGEESLWFRLYNRHDCIQGFFIDAFNHPDWDNEDTLIVLWATTPDGRSRYELQSFELGYVYIKDYNERRNFRRGRSGHGPNYPGPNYPGPVRPDPYPGNSPTVQWFDLGTVRAQKGLRTVHTFPVNQAYATEAVATALHADIAITQAVLIDQFGQPHVIAGLAGRVPKNFPKTARLSPYGYMSAQAIRVEIMSDNLIGSRGELNLKIGVGR